MSESSEQFYIPPQHFNLSSSHFLDSHYHSCQKILYTNRPSENVYSMVPPQVKTYNYHLVMNHQLVLVIIELIAENDCDFRSHLKIFQISQTLVLKPYFFLIRFPQNIRIPVLGEQIDFHLFILSSYEQNHDLTTKISAHNYCQLH